MSTEQAMRVGVIDDPTEEVVEPEPEPKTSGNDDVPPDPPKTDLAQDEPKPEDELWSGGPTFANVEGWKSEFGDVYVTSLTPDTHFVWRTLTRFEYRRMVKNLEQQVASGQVSQAEANLNNEEAISEICILFPQVTRTEMSGQMAGIASIISQEVLSASGFEALEVRML